MKCQFIKANNHLCKAISTKTSNYCFRHDPTNGVAKLAASIKGGKNRVLKGVYGEEIALDSPEDIRRFISLVINRVWTGRVPVPVGTSMGFLAKCWLEAHNSTELDKRIKLLEERVEKVK